MTEIVFRSKQEPFREGLTWEERWKGPDKGLITCWEVGQRIREENPELAESAMKGELPPLGWKGGVERKLKAREKIGTLMYLAQWQGLRGEDLDIDTGAEPQHVCTRTGMRVIFTGDYEKYKNA